MEEPDGDSRLNLLGSDPDDVARVHHVLLQSPSPRTLTDGEVPIAVHESGAVGQNRAWSHDRRYGGVPYKASQEVGKSGRFEPGGA